MKSVKLFLGIAFTLIAFLFLITAFLPSKVTVSKSIIVNASKLKIFAQINDFNNWKNWYPAFQNKQITVDIYKKNKQPFAVITNEKKQTVTFTLLKSDNNNINFLLSKQNEKDIYYQFILMPNGNGKTQLTWNINTTLGWYPWKKLSGIFLDKVSGPQYDFVLGNLKAAAEK